LFGATASLISLLDACLVSGYASQTPPSPAWTKPFANVSGSTIGCYQPGSGSVMSLSVNDSASGAGGAKEARMMGWETLTSVASGSNNFPSPTQSTSGSICRKSATADTTTARTWTLLADSSTFYLFVQTGDVASTYFSFCFGDFFSLKGSLDSYRSTIIGRNVENSAAGTNETLDLLSGLSTGTAGHFVPRTYLGTSAGSIAAGCHGDAIKGSATSLSGSVPYPNGPDSGIYISPVWIVDSATSNVRGRLRGFYQFLHAISNVSDGQTYTGSGDFSGKSFMVIKSSGNSGVYLMETSATIETN
jgi:hypothetical protein